MNERAYDIDRTYDGLRASDDIFAKALGLSGQAQCAKIEVRLRKYIEARWNELARRAGVEAARCLVNGAGESVDGKDLANATAIVNHTMIQWVDLVSARFKSDIEEIYRVSRKHGTAKALGLIHAGFRYTLPENVAKADISTEIRTNFDLNDYKALESFNKHQTYWLGKAYSDNVSQTIANGARSQIYDGMGRVEAGKKMAELVREHLGKIDIPDGYQGSVSDYFEMLVANATTTGRVAGHVRSFSQVGVNRLVVVNPIDEHTCEVCRMMDGKEFTVSEASAQVGRLVSAKDPTTVRSIQPWLSAGKLKGLIPSGKSGLAQTRSLVGANITLPPYHGKCRCDVDVVV
jgi:hypothetical protein